MPAISIAQEKTSHIKRESFPVLEMTCAACAVSVESMLKATPGVKDARVNFANQTAWVEYDNKLTSPRDLQKSVQSIGYDLVVDVADPQAVQEEAQLKYYAEIKKQDNLVIDPGGTCRDHWNVLYGYALWQLYLHDPFGTCGLLFRTQFFRKRVETGEVWKSEHGYIGSFVDGNCISL